MAVTCNQKGRVRWLSPEEKFKVPSPVIVVEGFAIVEETVDLIVPKTIVEAPKIVEKKKEIITPKKREYKKKVVVEPKVKKDDWL